MRRSARLFLVSFLLTLVVAPVMVRANMDIIFVIDGSGSVESCLITFQTNAIANALCGTNCSPCNGYLPTDGTAAIGVVRFDGNLPGGESTDVFLTVINNSATGQSTCSQIIGITRPLAGGTTPLAAGLDAARTEFQTHGRTGASRVVILVSDTSDASQVTGDAAASAAALRTMSNPATICAFRFVDGKNLNGDAPCFSDPSTEYMAGLANVFRRPLCGVPYPGEPSGLFLCRRICDGTGGCTSGNCGTCLTSTCVGQDDIDAFRDFVIACTCALNRNGITITQQTQQSPSGSVAEGTTVTLSVAATANWIGPTYQWQRDGQDYLGATSSSLVLSNVQRCDAGVYRCVIRTPCDTKISNSLTLVVTSSGQDCNVDQFADSCQFAPPYDWSGIVLTDDTIGDFGNGIASNPSGDIVYVGTFHLSSAANTDFDPTTACDVQAVAASGGGNGTFITRLIRSGSTYQYNWTKQIAPSSGSVDAKAVVLDASGNIYFTGKFTGTNVDFDPNAGAALRTSSASGTLPSCFVTSLSSTGTHRWTRIIPGTDATQGVGLTLDRTQSTLIVTGSFYGTADFNSGGGGDNRTAQGTEDIFVTKLVAANGNTNWTYAVAGIVGDSNSKSSGNAVAVDLSNDIYVTGRLHSFNPSDFNPSGGVNGCSGPAADCLGSSNNDVFLLKLSSAGAFQWVQAMGGGQDDAAYAIAIDHQGEILITGSFQNTATFAPANPSTTGTTCSQSQPYCHQTNGQDDAFVVKLHPSASGATHVWSRAFGGNDGGEFPYGLVIDFSDNAIICGSFHSTQVDFDPTNGLNCSQDLACRTIIGKPDIFVEQWRGNGSFGWVYTMGGTGQAEARGVTLDDQRGTWLTGYVSGTIDLNPASWGVDLFHTLGDSLEVFIMRFKPTVLPFVDCNSNGVLDACETCCRGDVNRDGSINGKDIQPFVDKLLAGGVCAPGFCEANANADGVLDINDVPPFVILLLQGGGCTGFLQYFPDCNTNGIDDATDIGTGTSGDCNANFIPDECDISNATSTDINGNGIPDECEPDCNKNGKPDSWDISHGVSLDVNSNFIPDECEKDCDHDGLPDAYEIAQGQAQDCNSNGVPDLCDSDCNHNHVPDDCEIASNSSLDCNSNGTIDSCDLALPYPYGSLDCNTNGIPDECDLVNCDGDPACSDCNGNHILDACDIASGHSSDDDSDGIPDECGFQQFGMSGVDGGDSAEPQGGTDAAPFDEEAAWEAYYDWAAQQCWGPNCVTTGAAQFEALVEKLSELGLPLVGQDVNPSP